MYLGVDTLDGVMLVGYMSLYISRLLEMRIPRSHSSSMETKVMFEGFFLSSPVVRKMKSLWVDSDITVHRACDCGSSNECFILIQIFSKETARRMKNYKWHCVDFKTFI